MCADHANVGSRLTRPWRLCFLLVAALAVVLPELAAANCTHLNATAVAFGSYNPLSGTPLDAVGTVSYRCNNTPPVISLSKGYSSTFMPRQMVGPSVLTYNLYQDAARTVIWGDGTGGTSVENGPTGQTTLSVYGRVPALQNVKAGTYSDVVVVTLNF